MWGASARAHVQTSFERWCLLARSSIADQGVILVFTGRMSPFFSIAFRHLFYIPWKFQDPDSLTFDPWRHNWGHVRRKKRSVAHNLQTSPFLLVIWMWTCSTNRGVADGGVGGYWPPHFWKPGRSTPQIREWGGQNPVFFRFFGCFGGLPPCRRFDPPLKNPWRRTWVSSSTHAFHRSSSPTQVNRGQLRSIEANCLCRLFEFYCLLR